ncbi:DHH family phosphoesterase [Amphibacillus cookii]|uniref:DHH family phosphoesterase n=1 Tax=Amphibacillus cookii TaxID=767787 RepID=UPI0019593628|nr:bifunctional oligoribonuclease/PAP phosphatase NrnA [Amphibacillus cookii]MBM7541925.1 phosphoesterase RecJ-like protein [Amphibacillus cookii]
MNDVTERIIDRITVYNRIIIHRHVRPDPDALGAQVGLAKAIQTSFPEKEVYCVGEDEASLGYLATMDQIADNLYENALVIICDTANRPRIDDQRFMKASEVIKIDHHPEVDSYGDVSWVNTNASSTSEMIYTLISGTQQGLKMNTEVARLLYAGMVGDTGRFLFPSTTPYTFKVAAELVRYPFDRSALYNQMYEMELPIAQLKGYLLDQLDHSPTGVCTVKLTKEILERYQVTADQTSALVGVFGDIKGIKCWAIFVEEEQLIRVRLRSKGVAINEIAAQFNGGGHPLAAGATVYSWQEADQLKAELEQACQ